jgi:hypothetical protein
MSLSVLVKADEAPAFNFVVRVLTPIVYLLLTASILYAFNLDRFTHKFYVVSFYYIMIRLIINLLTDTRLLLNWYRQFLYWFVIMVLSYYAYEKIIITKKNLVPDFTTIANELWIIVLIFLYHISNNIELSSKNTFKRKKNYLKSKYFTFEKKYGYVITTLESKKLMALAYSILIYENFNRPYVIRLLENTLLMLTNKPRTLGIMQVRSSQLIDDYESVTLGVEKLRKDYQNLKNAPKEDSTSGEWSEWYLIANTISAYNGGEKYREQVMDILDFIEGEFFLDHDDSLPDDVGF